MENAVPSGVSNVRFPVQNTRHTTPGRSMERNGAIVKMSVPLCSTPPSPPKKNPTSQTFLKVTLFIYPTTILHCPFFPALISHFSFLIASSPSHKYLPE